jgi:hypothetical protein
VTVAIQGELVPSLREDERALLDRLEQTIDRDLATFVEVGLALKLIRDRGLYRDVTPPTFEAYLRQRWGMSKPAGYRVMDSARVARAVATSPGGDVAIPNEATARLLIPWLDRESDDQPGIAQIWESIAPRLVEEPVTPERVRRALVDAGHVPDDRYRASSGRTNRAVLLGQYGDRLAKAQARLVRFIDRELGDQPLPDGVRAQAARYSETCERMAHVLRRLAEGDMFSEGSDEL